MDHSKQGDWKNMMNSDPSVLVLELRQFHHHSQLHKIRFIIYNRLNYKVLHRKFCNFVRIHQTISNKKCRNPTLCVYAAGIRGRFTSGEIPVSAFRERPWHHGSNDIINNFQPPKSPESPVLLFLDVDLFFVQPFNSVKTIGLMPTAPVAISTPQLLVGEFQWRFAWDFCWTKMLKEIVSR